MVVYSGTRPAERQIDHRRILPPARRGTARSVMWLRVGRGVTGTPAAVPPPPPSPAVGQLRQSRRHTPPRRAPASDATRSARKTFSEVSWKFLIRFVYKMMKCFPSHTVQFIGNLSNKTDPDRLCNIPTFSGSSSDPRKQDDAIRSVMNRAADSELHRDRAGGRFGAG